MRMPEQPTTLTARKRFSPTRARPAGGSLNAADRRRAAVVAALGRATAWVVGYTMRLRTFGEERLAGFRRLGSGPLLFALWHGDFFPIFHYGRGHGICVVVSRSLDGEALARVLRHTGYRTVRGSTSRGATRAMIDLARVVRSGTDAAIAVDGPRGPRQRAKPGIVLLAKITGCPIVPLGVGMNRCKQFASWDRFRLPAPVSRVVIATDEAIQVPPDATTDVLADKRRELEASLLALRDRAQKLVEPDAFRHAERPKGFACSRIAPRPQSVMK